MEREWFVAVGTIAVGNFTAVGIRQAVYMLAALLVGMSLRELARAWTAAQLHDPTPRLWGRITLSPRAWFDPFGSGLIPALIAVLWSVAFPIIPAAYGKPAPVDPGYFRQPTRDTVFVSSAGPAMNLAVGILAGLIFRASLPVEALRIALVVCYSNMALMVFHLLPIPGLDGARMVALILPPAARETYRNGDRYLPLFVLVALFVFTFLVLGVLTALTGALCSAATGADCVPLLGF
jgi:Zn-dependent protease